MTNLQDKIEFNGEYGKITVTGFDGYEFEETIDFEVVGEEITIFNRESINAEVLEYAESCIENHPCVALILKASRNAFALDI